MTTEKTQLTLSKIQVILTACILLTLIIGCIFLAQRVVQLQNCLDLVEKDLQALDMDSVNEAVDALTDAANQLAAVDVDTLNDTITSLRDAADTLKSVDITALNSLVDSLETVANKLQNAVNAVTGIFGR